MRNLLLSLGVVLLIVGCTKFEIITEIDPKISIIERDIGFIYKLGNIQISHTIEKVDRDIINYIDKEKDKAETVFGLRVYYSEAESSGLQFLYFINGMSISDKANNSPVSKEMLLANMDNIPGFYLYKLEGKEVSEENKEEINAKIEKVKKKMEEENKNKYAPLENKWE